MLCFEIVWLEINVLSMLQALEDIFKYLETVSNCLELRRPRIPAIVVLWRTYSWLIQFYVYMQPYRQYKMISGVARNDKLGGRRP